MGIDIKKETCSCSDENACSDCSCTGCKCTITFGGDSKKEKSKLQEFIGHLSNIAWILFMLAFVFSNWTFLIVALLVVAIVLEEFD